jgi:GDP-4-dehydro-6-deoxy-D-mannose reductase
MRDVLESRIGFAPVRLEIEPDPKRMRPAELPVVCRDALRLWAATGWAPRIPLEHTLADMLESARQEATERMAST